MNKYQKYKLFNRGLVLCLILKQTIALAQQNTNILTSPLPVSNITTPTITPTNPNNSVNLPKSDAPEGKYSEHQSICRNEYAFVQEPKEAFSQTTATELHDLFKKEPSTVNFGNLFNFYYINKKHDDLKSLFLDNSKILKPLEIAYYDSKIKFLKKKYSEAITALNKQLEETPDEENLLLLLADNYKEIGNLFEAKSIYQDLTKKHKKDPSKYILQLCILETLDSSHGEAESICKLATKLLPQNELPRIYLGINYREETSYDKAIDQFTLAINLKPTEFGLTCLAETYALKQDYKKASEYYKKSFELEPRSGRAILGLALNDVVIKQYESALASFKIACDLDKKTSLPALKETYKKVEEQKIKIATQYYSEVQRCNQK